MCPRLTPCSSSLDHTHGGTYATRRYRFAGRSLQAHPRQKCLMTTYSRLSAPLGSRRTGRRTRVPVRVLQQRRATAQSTGPIQLSWLLISSHAPDRILVDNPASLLFSWNSSPPSESRERQKCEILHIA